MARTWKSLHHPVYDPISWCLCFWIIVKVSLMQKQMKDVWNLPSSSSILKTTDTSTVQHQEPHGTCKHLCIEHNSERVVWLSLPVVSITSNLHALCSPSQMIDPCEELGQLEKAVALTCSAVHYHAWAPRCRASAMHWRACLTMCRASAMHWCA